MVRVLFLGGMAAAIAGGVTLGQALWGDARGDAKPEVTGKVDKEADQLLRKMSAYMGKLPAFSTQADHILEVVTKDGQKLQFGATSKVVVKRPNKLRTDRKGEVVDLSFYYDGKNMSLYGRRVNMYATAPAPADLDAAIDFGRQSLGLEAPGADLLHSNPYEILMEEVVSGKYVGKTLVRGTSCHHLAFRNQETDWQLWVAEGDEPLPCKYVITSKKMDESPQFAVELYDWDTDPEISNEIFTLTPPEDAMQIEFFGLSEEARKERTRVSRGK